MLQVGLIKGWRDKRGCHIHTTVLEKI